MVRLIFACLIALCSTAHAADSAWLIGEIRKARKGAEILVPAGEYDLTDIKIRKDLSLIGDGAVTFFSSRTTAKGILNPTPFVSLRIENITFRGARSRDRNGAGIRHDGKDLTVINCQFIGNENGILATGDVRGDILLQNATFTNNGFGDGYSHGIYVSSGRSLTVSDSKFVGTKVGHHIKSLAEDTLVEGSVLDDADGGTSYSIDASRGGLVTIVGNTIIQTRSSQNEAIINYDLTRGGDARGLIIADNIITNHHPRGLLLRNKTSVATEILNNDIINEGAGRLRVDRPRASPRAQDNQDTQSAERRKQAQEAYRKSALTEAPTEPKGLSVPPLAIVKSAKGYEKAPIIAQETGALFTVIVENNSGISQTADYVTFAHPFAPGAFQGGAISATFDGQPVASQLDIKARHDDGSIRHGVFTVATRPLNDGDIAHVSVFPVSSPSFSSSPFDAAEILEKHYQLPVLIEFLSGSARDKPFVYDARSGALTEVKRLTPNMWLDGPLVKSFRFEKTAASHLRLRFDVSVYRDGDIHTSVTFANDKTFSPGPRDLNYAVEIGDASSPVFSVDDIAHHRSSVWRRQFWSGVPQQLNVVFDKRTLEASGAIAPLDGSLGVRRSVIAANLEKTANLPPLDPGIIQPYFPQAGGRPDIGLYTQWTAHYLATQSAAAKAVMLNIAEAGAGAPWHLRDERTGAAVRIDKRPKFWADRRGLERQYAPDRPHPDLFDGGTGGWTLDQSHKPSLAYVPYLVTGDRFFADLLSMQAAYAVSGEWPKKREGGLTAIDIGQVRGSAWSLRDINNAAYILPDANPLKQYFQEVLLHNLDRMARKYIDNRTSSDAGELEGYFDEFVHREPERISPWQNDFMAMALFQTANTNQGKASKHARDLLNWASNFQAGRFLTDAWPLTLAAGSRLNAKTAADQTPLTTWAQTAIATFGSGTQNTTKVSGYPEYGAGYIASGYGALAAIASQTKSLSAYEAFVRLAGANRSHPMWQREQRDGVAKNNGFFFKLTLRSGEQLSHDAMFKKAKSAALLLGGDAKNNVLKGGVKGDVLSGMGGDDTLTGEQGDDDLFGGSGNDTLDGGEGDDRLVGGAGDNRLTGGQGADIFALRPVEKSADTVSDFNPVEDKIGVILKLGDPVPDLTTVMEDTPSGLRITLSSSSSVLLERVDSTALSQTHLIAIQ